MGPLQRPCPRCSFSLEIPKPAPVQLQCPQCGGSIKLKGAPADKEAVTASPPVAPVVAAGPPRKKLILWGAGAVAFVAGGIFLVVWAFRGGVEPTNNEDPAGENKIPNQIVFKPLPAPPPDPRIKIVQPAVDKGVAFLKKHVLQLGKMPAGFLNPEVEGYLNAITGQPQPKGIRPGYAGLVGLALLEGGLAHDDPAILQIANIIRQAAPQMIGIYDLSASLFFLNRWQEGTSLNEQDRAMAQTLALRIIAGQLSSGIWGYRGVVMTPETQAKLLAALEQGTYKPGGPAAGPTMSCTQFAMLAVWGSRKHGVPVREPMLALSAYFHDNQQPNGNWVYPGASLAATSTCAGLISLALERVLLEDKEFALGRPAPVRMKKADVNKAFEFLGKTIGRKKGDPNSGSSGGYGGGFFDADSLGDLYFLWTLERVGVIYSREVIGDRDWFDWGYPIVLKEQNQNDGSWEEKHRLPFGPLIDTSFAILFLKRSNIAKDVTDKLRLLQGGTASQESPVSSAPPMPNPKE